MLSKGRQESLRALRLIPSQDESVQAAVQHFMDAVIGDMGGYRALPVRVVPSLVIVKNAYTHVLALQGKLAQAQKDGPEEARLRRELLAEQNCLRWALSDLERRGKAQGAGSAAPAKGGLPEKPKAAAHFYCAGCMSDESYCQADMKEVEAHIDRTRDEISQGANRCSEPQKRLLRLLYWREQRGLGGQVERMDLLEFPEVDVEADAQFSAILQEIRRNVRGGENE